MYRGTNNFILLNVVYYITTKTMHINDATKLNESFDGM